MKKKNKKERKGFTLIELLATIVILGIILSITIVGIVYLINNTKKKTYVMTETNIVSTALIYAKENNTEFYTDNDREVEYQCVTVQELIDTGYFKKDVNESKIILNDESINVTSVLPIYVDRNITSKVFGEGHLIKNEEDEYYQYCEYVTKIECPDVEDYFGEYDGNEHSISIGEIDPSIKMRYRTATTGEGSNWVYVKPTRKYVGSTTVYTQVGREGSKFRYCNSATIQVYKKKIEAPSCEDKTYNGTEQVLLPANPENNAIYLGYYNNVSKGTNAGPYETELILNENYMWSDNSTDNLSKRCEIKPKKLTVTWDDTPLYYNGSEQAPNASVTTGVTGERMVLNIPKESGIGTHTTTATCSSVVGGNEKCSNYELENATKTYEINRIHADIPTNAYCISRTYNGSEQTLTNNPGSGYTFSGNKKINAGTYTITATLKENYIWNDGTTETKTFTCSIDRKNVSEPSCTQVHYDGETHTLLEAKAQSQSSSNGYWNDAITGKEVGSYSGTLHLNSNYRWSSGSNVTSDRTKTCSVSEPLEITVTIPTDTYCVSRTYNGLAQDLTSAPGEGFTFSNYMQTNAGMYIITATLKDGYKWNDGTKTPKRFSCYLSPKEISVSWGTLSLTYDGTELAPTATANTGVSGETMTLNTTKNTDVGTYTSTATCKEVYGGMHMCENYTLTNNTASYSILYKRHAITFVYLSGSVDTKTCNVISNDACNITAPSISGYWTGTAGTYGSGATISVNSGLNGKVLNEKAYITIPTNAYCVSRTFNGCDQTLTNNPGSGYTFSGNKGRNAGSYTVTATLQPGNIWSDGTTGNKTFTCSISKKSVSVEWGSVTEFIYNGSLQGPSVSVSTGVFGEGSGSCTGDTMVVEATKEKGPGSFTSHASCKSVTGNSGGCNNYILGNLNKSYIIKQHQYKKRECQASTGYYCSSGQILYNNVCYYPGSVLSSVTSAADCHSPYTWIPYRSACYTRGCNPASSQSGLCGGKCSIGVCACTTWGGYAWSTTDCGSKNEKACQVSEERWYY